MLEQDRIERRFDSLVVAGDLRHRRARPMAGGRRRRRGFDSFHPLLSFKPARERLARDGLDGLAAKSVLPPGDMTHRQ
jgi:hypothetical protein